MSECDVFISYKSEDVEAVRDVAEILRTNGVKTWFAEYAIHLNDWIAATDSWIDQTLQQAVASSSHMLVFSSDKWHGSKWCNAEHDNALKHHGVDNISIIRLSACDVDAKFNDPVHQVFEFDQSDPQSLCRFLSQRLKRNISCHRALVHLEGRLC